MHFKILNKKMYELNVNPPTTWKLNKLEILFPINQPDIYI